MGPPRPVCSRVRTVHSPALTILAVSPKDADTGPEEAADGRMLAIALLADVGVNWAMTSLAADRGAEHARALASGVR